MPIDMSKYLGLFTSESQEHLDALSRELVQLEKGARPDLVDSMFRHAHSVKGMAASMGFEQIATLAHRVEDLVDQVRKNPAVMSAEIADLLFASTDHLQGMVGAAGASQPFADAAPLIARIGERLVALTGKAPAATQVNTAATVQPAAPPPVAPAPPPASAPAAGTAALARWAVRVKIAPACPVPGVRAFLVHKKLSALGNVFDLKPPLDDLKAGRLPEGMVSLQLELPGAGGGDAIRKALGAVSDLVSVDVTAVEMKAAGVPAKPEPPPAPEGPKPLGVEPAHTVRVKTEMLDYFLDAAGELLLATSQLRQTARGIPEAYQPALEEGIGRLHSLVKDLHDKVMSVRMTPLALITDRLPRAARDIARRRAREVDLVITGADIELDRAILDELSDPLLHILRNCIDHGIEDPAARQKAGKGARGRVVVAARRDRDRVVLEIEDDGKGMDVARLKAAAVERGLVTPEAAAAMGEREAMMLCCLPGVSTASGVTDVSGRGVGMDAARRAVENVGGTMEIDSTPGRGTRFTLRLPLTVAVVNVLLVGVGREVFGLPIAKVKAVVELDPATLSRSRNAPMLSHGGALVPVQTLGELLAVERRPGGGVRPHVILDSEPGQVAVEVDQLLGQEEAVLKPLSRPLDLIAGLAGVTILGTGRPIFILDVPRLVA